MLRDFYVRRAGKEKHPDDSRQPRLPRNREHFSPIDLHLDVRVHPRTQLGFGIRYIYSNASCPLRWVNSRIDDRNLTLESLVREGRKTHIDLLPSLQETDLVFVKLCPNPKIG